MEFRVLGPLEVLDGDRALPLGGAKQRAALAILLLHRNVVVSRDRLIQGIWGDAPPVSASPTLDTYMSRLRKVLRTNGPAPRLVTRPPGYLLRVEDGELDLQRFETLLDRARSALASGDRGAAGKDLREALSLFRGGSLEDLAHAPFAQAESGRLDELRLGALELRLDWDLESGRHAEVVGELESLVARFPFRECFWAQLMLALYRSGRQGDALLAFERARRTLADELGVDPGQPLQRLHQRILQQDPSLEFIKASAASAASTRGLPPDPRPAATPPSTKLTPSSMVRSPSAPAGRGGGRRHWWRPPGRAAAVVSAALAVVAVLVTLLPTLRGGSGGTPSSYDPGTVLLDLQTGKQTAFIAPALLEEAAYPVFAKGHFWAVNFSPGAFVEIDPRTGRILKQLTPPARDPSVLADSASLTPFAVEGTTLWATSAHDLVRMDIGLGKEVDRFRLDGAGAGSGLAEGVAVGAGSVWVSRDVGSGQILRLDPATGKVEHRWDGITPYMQLAFGDGFLWAADETGIARIDAQTNLIAKASDIQGNQMVATGGGFGWTSDDTKGVVYKVDKTGRLVATYSTGLGATFMSFTDGALWVGNHDEGTVTGIDAVTGKLTTHRFGHPVMTVAAGGGILLVSLAPGATVEDHINALTGKVARVFAHKGELGEGDEPALNRDPAAFQIDFATCAKLLNYPDKPVPDGWQLRPEVAAAMPTVSPDGRTYTFRVRPGYRFSPPFNQPVTAETFRFSIERALSPRLAEDVPGPLFLGDIVGEHAFRDGRARHISGLKASAGILSITLVKPSPDFLQRLTLPFFCPVPIGTPFSPQGFGGGAPFGGQGIPSAGPYYVAEFNNEEYVILKRNPNYHGPRPHAVDAIAIREGVDASTAVDRMENQGWDGITNLSGPLLEPGGPLDQRWGAGSEAAASGDQQYFLNPVAHTRFIAFNASHGIFADPRVRRAATLALDRTALAAVWGQLPTDQILSPALPSYADRKLYPIRGSVAQAKALMEGRGGTALMPVPSECDQCMRAAQVVQTDLSAIGIDVQLKKLDDFSGVSKSGAGFDLLDGDTEIVYPDSASFLTRMLLKNLPQRWVPAGIGAEIKRLATLGGNHRQTVAAALADRLAADDAPVAAYGTAQSATFIGQRLGCRVFPPFGYGIDLAALCLEQGSSPVTSIKGTTR